MPDNLLLSRLPESSRRRLAAELKPVDLQSGQTLFEPESLVSQVYFPTTCVISLVAELETGGRAEASLVGFEGFVGLPVLYGQGTSSLRAITQIPGSALRIPYASLRDHLQADSLLREVLAEFAYLQFEVTAQMVICRAYHDVEARLSRWLLMCHDRLPNQTELPLTQDFLANMLATHRPTVTIAARLLQAAGLINYHRGHVSITDREALEAAACECYAFIARKLPISTET